MTDKWNKDSLYSENDIVTHDGIVWIAVDDSWGSEPNNRSNLWKPEAEHIATISQDNRDIDDLDINQHDMDSLYDEGTVVSKDDKAYKSLMDHMGKPVTDTKFWKQVNALDIKEPEEDTIDEPLITGTKDLSKPEPVKRDKYKLPDKSVIIVKQSVIERDGKQGSIGLTGNTGLQGLQGIQGEQGIQGSKGDKGDKGDSYNPKELDTLREELITGMGSMNRFKLTSVGSGTSLIAHAKPRVAELKSLIAGSNITITHTATTITIASTGGSGSGTVSSVSVVNANGFSGTVATATTTPAITISTTVTGLLKGNGTAISAATAGTDYQSPITLTTTGTSGAATFIANTLNIPQYAGTTYSAGTGLTLTGSTFSVNTSQNIIILSNLTSNGFVKTTGGTGTLSIDTNTYLTANQTITLSGDVTGTGTTSITTTLATVNSNVGSFTNANITVNAKGLITAASNGSGGSSASAVTNSISQASHGFSVGNVIRLNGTSTYTKAQSDSVVNAEAIGIVSTVTNANAFIVTTSGYITGLSGLTANTVYFLDPSTSGALTVTQPSIGGQISKPVFVSDTTTSGYFINYRGLVIPSGSANAFVNRASIIVATSATGSTQIPADNTIPQNTEGDQYMSLSYTPANASNVLVIRVIANVSATNAVTLTGALFQDSIANALSASGILNTTTSPTLISLTYTMTAGTTSSTTFKVRIGGSGTNTTSFNGVSGTQRYGGVVSSVITIEEYIA